MFKNIDNFRIYSFCIFCSFLLLVLLFISFFSSVDLTEFTITVEDIKPEVKPVFVENHEMEFLIDAIMSCQEAVYPNLKKHYKYARVMEQQHYKLFVRVYLHCLCMIIQCHNNNTS